FEIVLRLALQLFGNGIQNHGYAPLHRELNFHRCGQQLVNQKNLRHARFLSWKVARALQSPKLSIAKQLR
ncbi:MAG: hypothetical protein ACODTL_01160, partial [Brucella sp.]